MLRAATLVAALVGLATAANNATLYQGQSVLRCQRHGKTLDAAGSMGLDVWAHHADTMDIRVRSADEAAALTAAAGDCDIFIADLEAAVDEANRGSRGKVGAGWHEAYHTYEEIVAWYKELAQKHADLVKYVPSIGASVEGREQPAVHITSGKTKSPLKVYFQCQIHAREWISGATCMYMVDEFVTKYGGDKHITDLLDNLEIIVIPFVNPDGYAFTWANNGERLWRKNRATNAGSTCRGVDLNRNYPEHWAESGSSNSPCSETYHGPAEASEPETQHTVNYFKANGPIVGAIDWHAYSELILRPYGWTFSPCPDEKQLGALGARMRDAAESVHGVRYSSTPSADLYPTSGTASDWFYEDDAAKNNGGYRWVGGEAGIRGGGVCGTVCEPFRARPSAA